MSSIGNEERMRRGGLPSNFGSGVAGPEAHYQELQAELEHRLLVLVDQLRARIAVVAAELGLTPQQAMLLRHLGQPRTMGDIAAVLACDRSNVTGMVDRLTARGLLDRVPDPADRRVKYLVLTDDGRALRAALQARLFAHSPAIDALQPPERYQLLQLLRRVTPEIIDVSPDGIAPRP
jgi:MarR family transcriptional regulator, organic hydroperoxide resistance regulator